MGKRDAHALQGEEEGEDVLIKCGMQLLGLQKSSKDAVVKLLKAASKVLEDAPQTSARLKQASGEICKAVGRPELLKHRDKEVRLYVAVCAIHTLRLHAPETPYSDAQLDTIFRLVTAAFGELAEPSAPHFRLCLSLLETAAQVKCCLLMLDLEAADSLVVDLFTTMLDSLNSDNRDLVEAPVLEVLASMIEEGDDVSQPLLDAILAALLPAARDENPARYRLAQLLLQRTQPAIQPHVQKFLTRLLDGARTDSDLAGSCSDLILQVYQAAPQITLPVMPHIEPSLQVGSEERRLEAVDLLCRLLTQPGAATLQADYPHLPEALLRRLGDKCTEVRRRVLQCAKSLADGCVEDGERQKVVDAVAQRLMDPEDRLRSAAATALCAIAADHPAAASAAHFSALINRLRDKRLGVRKDVAAQVARLVKVWCMRLEEGGGALPKRRVVVELALGLCNLTCTSDRELAVYILDDLFRAGIFPAKLPAASVARWWAQMWRAAGAARRGALGSVLHGKCDLQRQVQELLRLRAAGKEHRAAASSVAGSAGNTAQDGSPQQQQQQSPGGSAAAQQLEERLGALAAALQGAHRAEEGLSRLWGMKDNHIFRSLAVLAAFGTPYAQASEAARDVQQRVGSKGPAAEAAAVLTARLLPNIISPEVLNAALAATGDSQEAQALVLDVAAAAPELLAQALPAATEALAQDDPLVAECGARVLGAAGGLMRAHAAATGPEVPAELQRRLEKMALSGHPPAAKGAVRALVLTLGADAAIPPLRRLCGKLLSMLRRPDTLKSHCGVVAALKALAQVGRLVPAVLGEFVDDLHSCVMGHLLSQDLSRGRPLLPKGTVEEGGAKAEGGLVWGRPSADVAVKAAAIKALAQALVPDDPKAEIPEATAAVVAQLVAQLEAFTEPDPASEAFSAFRWRVLDPPELQKKQQQQQQQAEKGHKPSGGGRKRKADEARSNASCLSEGSDDSGSHDAAADGAMDWDDMGEEEQEAAAAAAAAQSPDAGCVRLAAASALLRLCRAHDSSMSGDTYVNLALACQDALPDVRVALLAKIQCGVAHFQQRRPAPQRAAKLAALYALYGADPHLPSVRIAYTQLREYVAARRAAVEIAAAAAAAAGEGGTLIDAMPEFLLPFLVFLVANHPDYDPETAWQPLAAEDEDGIEASSPVGLMFQRMLQLALEALLVPPGAAAGDKSNVVRLLPASLKLLRQLKFCDVVSLEDRDVTDEGATAAAHQVCDIALSLAKEVAARVNGRPVVVGRFPGSVALPRLCYRPRKNLQRDDKRGDGSDLPPAFRLHLDQLFSSAFGALGAATQPAPRGARPRSKPRTTRGDEEVEQQPRRQKQQRQQQRSVPADSAEEGELMESPSSSGQKRQKPAGSRQRQPAAKRRTKPPPTLSAAAAATPARQQPRRGAKDAAGMKLHDAATGSGEDFSEFEEWRSLGEEGPPAAATRRNGPSAVELRAHTSDEESSRDEAGDTSPQQENGDKLNKPAAAKLSGGGKPKQKSKAAVKPVAPQAKRVRA